MKIASVEQIREIDRRTIHDFEVPGLILMESAALRTIEVLKERFEILKDKNIVVVCGKGNNGGDGLAIARHLHQHHKAAVQILLVANAKAFTGDALVNFKMAKNYGIEILPAKDFKYDHCDIIIDAIFGTGFQGEVDDSTSLLIENINQSKKFVVAVDVPSGLDLNSDCVNQIIIKANLTITFGLAKYAMLVYPGLDYVGELVVSDIGAPDEVINSLEINTFTTEVSDVNKCLPQRKNQRDTNKGQYGHVLVLAGSPGFSGAPILVAEAAQHAGAGKVTLAIPRDLACEITSRLSPVIMTHGLSQTRDSSLSLHAAAEALALAESVSVVALGPGIGLGDEVAEFMNEFVTHCPVPLVIDADALTLLAKLPDAGQAIIKNRKAATVLTPHPAEMARLLGTTTKIIQKDRRDAIQQAVKKFNCVVLLKGSCTLISDSSGNMFLNTTGNPGLSSGGSGDVLSGVIAGFLAQNPETLSCVASAAFVHGLAGDLIADNVQGFTGIIASGLITYLPKAIAQCQNQANS